MFRFFRCYDRKEGSGVVVCPSDAVWIPFGWKLSYKPSEDALPSSSSSSSPHLTVALFPRPGGGSKKHSDMNIEHCFYTEWQRHIFIVQNQVEIGMVDLEKEALA